MATFSRRRLLAVFGSAFPVAALSCRSRALRPDERVCVHVYPESLALPRPLLAEYNAAPERPAGESAFATGLPELFVCRTEIPFLRLFPYFWPVEPGELRLARASMRVLFAVERLGAAVDAERAVAWLAREAPLPPGTAGVLTYNDRTRFFCAGVLGALRAARVAETVVFKDPSVPPWLCDEPAVQKRFRRPPP